jgi:hypothetical protein
VPHSETDEALPTLLAGFAALALFALLLVAVGQPIFTDDVWWHLALGRAYALDGPWLAADPLLYTAAGPPAPAAWLADLALHGVERGAGFAGLRIAHVLLVAGILALVWSLLRRASASRVAASLGAGAFVALAAYRLVQLRPELFSVLATLALFRLLFERAAPPSWARIAVAVALLALWANLHAGFVLGPIFLATAFAALVVARPFRTAAQRPVDLVRARRLAVALCVGVVATGLNPSGFEQYLAYFAAGGETPELTRVADEWLRFEPFRLPVPRLPPSPLAWAIAWGLLVATPVFAVLALRSWRSDVKGGTHDRVDPVQVALAAAAIAAMLLAVRFLWLGIFPLLLVASGRRAGLASALVTARAKSWVAAASALLLVPTFVLLGDWPMISRGVAFSSGAYARPYPSAKYFANAVWLLADAGLEGKVYNDYSQGGFLGYWLAPELRAFVNGSLNVPTEVMDAAGAIRARRGLAAGETFLELLDREQVDVFLGTGLARGGPPNRPYHHTTRHLEGAAGWTLIYRDLSSAIHLRANARNRANLERVSTHYAALGVPFDSERGFEPERVLREAPSWAITHGLVPVHFEQLGAAASAGLDPSARARNQLAAIYAALGLYERAIRLDRSALASAPGRTEVRRRLAWSLLRLGRGDEALEVAVALEDAPPEDRASRDLVAAIRRYAAQGDPEAAASLAARLPLLTRAEARALRAGVAPAPARTRRR